MLMNARTCGAIAETIELADTRATRRRGLLGRDSLDASTALILLPSFSIHTAFMRFPIDALFVNREGLVVHVVRNMPPWRMAAAWRAHAVIELAAGTLDARDVRIGDRMYLAAGPTAADAAVSWPLPA
jgi:uncharacterized protein